MALNPSGVEFYNLCQKHKVPDYVKTASVPDLQWEESEDDDLSLVVADAIQKRLPCHTKAATWVSAALFSEHYHEYPDDYRDHVLRQLVKHACYFGIEDDVARLFQKDTELTKQASVPSSYPDEYYLSVEKRAGLMLTKDHVVKLAEWLLRHRDELSLPDCSKLAHRIMKRAGALNVAVPEGIERLLGLGITDPEKLADGLTKRASYGYKRNPSGSAELLSYVEKIRENGIQSGSPELYKLACLIDRFDINTFQSQERKRCRLPLPEELCYTHTVQEMEKVASQNVQLVNGDVFSHESLSKISRMDMEAEFARRLLDEKYGPGNYSVEPGSEYNKIKKYADRGFRDLK